MNAKSISKEDVISISANADFMAGPSIMLVDDQPAVRASAPLDRKQEYSKIVRWGPSNDLPQQVIALANKSPELLALLQFVVYFMYGDGLTYEVFESAPVAGKPRPRYVEGYDPEVEDFIEQNKLSDYLLESIIDLVWFNHGFSELILNKKRDKIVQIVSDEAAFCRFGQQNSQGFNDVVYINANWGMSTYTDDYTIPVDCLNTKDINLEQWLRNSDLYKAIYPTAFPGPGNIVYQGANWHALFKSGYYDVSILVPLLKKALMQYTMTIKYIIKVPEHFWVNLARDKGKEWSDLNYVEKKAMRKDLLDDMNKFLTGAENAGKSFISTFGWDEHEGKEIPGISIDALDDKMKDGVWIADAAEASSQFIRSLNLVPAIVGHLTGKGMGAGSGSDVRVHGNVQNKMMAPRRDIILSPLKFTAGYNGYRRRMPGFRFRVKDFLFDTLDISHQTTNKEPSNAEPDQQ